MAAAAEANTTPQATTDSGNSSVLPLNRDVRVLLAQFVDNGTLLNLRLACKELSWEMEDEFVERFFTCRQHLISSYSLEVLAEISSHPRLTRKLRKIELIAASPSHDPDTWKQWEGEHEELIYEYLPGLFRAIFGRLSRDKRSPAIAITDHTEVRGFGSEEEVRKYQNDDFWPMYCGWIMPVLISEIGRACFQLRKLELCAESQDHCLPPRVLSMSSSLPGAPQLPWLSLSVLSIAFDDDFTLSKTSDALKEMLSAAVNLTNLSVVNRLDWWDEDVDRDTVRFFANSAAHCPLRSLRVDFYSAQIEEFLQLLAAFTATLEELNLKSVEIIWPECWATVFQYLLDNIRLSKLHLDDLCRLGEHEIEVFTLSDAPDGTKFEAVGEELVNEGLRRMMSDPAYLERKS